ncbi:MAG: hypothetical protein KF752_20745 [Pirellulaceae bacterium]|nr:hypothetical protein [Pirellulaceae bacterium]
MYRLAVSAVILAAMLIVSPGCICWQTGQCGSCGIASGCRPACDNADGDPCAGACVGPCADDCENFYMGRGPLARFFGMVGCGGGTCGDLYVDEWLNEPPTADCCGYPDRSGCARAVGGRFATSCDDCGQCCDSGSAGCDDGCCGAGLCAAGGRVPLRGLLSQLWGRQYHGGCENCDCDSHGVVHGQPIINDGYALGQWAAGKRCGCNSGGDYESSDSFGYETSVAPSHIVPTPPPPTETLKVVPTPAPDLPPASAQRLNPAMRRVLR